MNASSIPLSRTIALVYADEHNVRRSRLREKLKARGFVIKKEYQFASKAFDFSTVELVIAIADNLGGQRANVERIASIAGVPFIAIPHQSSQWEVLDEYAPPPSVSPSLQLLSPQRQEEVDEDIAGLASLYAEENAEFRKREQKLTGDLGNVRAERDRLVSEVATLKGKVLKLETGAESAKLSAGEAATSEVSRKLDETTKRLEAEKRARENERVELDAALAANRQLLGERNAAREALVRSESNVESADKLRAQLEHAEDERDKAKTAAKMAAAREQSAWNQANAAKAEAESVLAKLRAREGDAEKREKEFAKRVEQMEVREKELAARPAKPAPPAASPISEVVRALRTLVKAGAMSEKEAFDRTCEALK